MSLKYAIESLGFTTNALIDLCSDHALGTSIYQVENALPEWIIDNGILRNSKANYFSIGLYAIGDGESVLLMTQNETAVVMLLVCKIDGKHVVLLNLRTEPGLIGLTNYSTTIQSTPSNYLRKHGGKSTPFIEVALDPESHGKVLYDAVHHDWGDYYLNKTKRFLIVELESLVEAPESFCWLTLETAKKLLLENHLVTIDLRVCISYLSAGSFQNSAKSNPLSVAINQKSLHSLNFVPGAPDSRGISVAFFKTETKNREVDRWIQPLLVPKSELKIRLAFTKNSSGRVYAIEKRSQVGLLGNQLWFPSQDVDGRIVRSVLTSAEGGRFWKYSVIIELIEVENIHESNAKSLVSKRWISEQDLSNLVSRSLQTSLELRMAWSLIYAKDLDTK